MRAKLFKFDRESREWKERGTGDVRLLKHRENGKTRLVMRRDKTLKVCANHYVVPDMKLSPNVGSDRSWVWNAAADVSEGEPEAQTLAIRFANSDSKFICIPRSVEFISLITITRREPIQGGLHQGTAGERGYLQQGCGISLQLLATTISQTDWTSARLRLTNPRFTSMPGDHCPPKHDTNPHAHRIQHSSPHHH
jgi:hypothetical protein